MRIAIDNLDGRGALDYTGTVSSAGRLKLERGLNVPSRCTAEVVVGQGGLPLPQRMARVVVTADDGTVLFTGYVASEPVQVAHGASSEGLLYLARVSAVSDEVLLDKVSPWVLQGGLLGEKAAAEYASYRAIAGEVVVQAAGAVSHARSEADGTLDVKALRVEHVRELANDVTVTGEVEPAAYVTECMLGDGSTSVFTLSQAPWAAPHSLLVEDAFGEAALDTTRWSVSDPASRVGLSGAGLTASGGTGTDGQTLVKAVASVEMGGTLLLDLRDVMLGAASDGMLGGFYAGTPVLANCFAGFRVRQSASGTGGVTTVVPVLNGVEVGASFAPGNGHRYRLRLRLHCPEVQRVLQQYRVMVDGAVQMFGSGASVAAPMHVVFEYVDEGVSSATPASVLYDSAATGGAVGGTPALCSLVLMNATQMYGSVGSVRLTRPGSLWVTSVLPSGARQTRLVGAVGEGADCAVQYGSADALGTPGKVTFFPGRVPVAGERIEVGYRGRQRSVARLQDAASVAAEARGGGSGSCRWAGHVVQEPARSSVDCESAAQAVLAVATSRAAALQGTYAEVNPSEDVWPGDVLKVTSDGTATALLVRRVSLEDGGCVPEVNRYKLELANDWAGAWSDGLGLRLNEAVATDAALPARAANGPAVALASLQGMTVTALSGSSLGVDAGVAPPAGGGIEVRRRDAGWGTGAGSDLVLRTPVRNFTVPRSAVQERFFVRMYDASATPVYSRFASAVLVTAPLG